MSDPGVSVLAPDRAILRFDARVVVALNPLEQERKVEADIVLLTVCKGKPEAESQSLTYLFSDAYESGSVLPLVMRNAQWRAIELLHDYIKKEHSNLSGSLASIRFVDGLADFSNWYSSVMLGCPWNLRESLYDLKERLHSQDLILLLDKAFEQTIVCSIE
jgi:hypothetical protein